MPSARPSATTLALTTLLLASLGGCSRATMLLESDVPLPTGLSTIRSSDIRRTDGTVSGGKFLLAGDVNDARDLITETAEIYRDNGWTIVRASGGLDLATGVFRKDDRIAEITLRRRALTPEMSTGMLEVKSATK
jgi:hypothetical protein